MKIKIEDVFRIKRRGFVVMLELDHLPKIGDLLGEQPIIGVDRFHTCVSHNINKYKVGVFVKDSPIVGEEVELSYK